MSRADETRDRILAVTRRLLEDGEPATMGRIADAAGVTRQLLYLRFDGRGDLLLQVARAVDRDARPADLQARIDGAPDAVTALREAVAVQGAIKPRIEAIVRAMERVADEDEEIAAVLAEREDARRTRAAAVVRRLAEQGRLAAGWDERDATDLLWAHTSQRAWRLLVVDRGWTTERWVDRTTRTLVAALVG